MQNEVARCRKAVSVRLVWPHGCEKSVLLSGSFWGWSHPRNMRRLAPFEQGGDEGPVSYYYDVMMIPGSYTFKFLVDGTWRTSANYPLCDTKLGQGIKNNLIIVPEAVPGEEEENGVVPAGERQQAGRAEHERKDVGKRASGLENGYNESIAGSVS